MSPVVQCPKCNAANRPNANYCMRCGKPLPPPDTAASQHARAFVQRELSGPYFGAFPQLLDFSPASLAVLDTLITEMWGTEGLAPGQPDWQPPPSKMPVVVNLGAYLGEVLVRHLPARWEMHPQHPDAVIAARVIDAQERRINPFAQLGARFRDGAGVSLVSLYTALTGRVLAPWTMPRAAAAPATPRPAPAPAPPAAPAAVDVAARLRDAAQACARGHFGNAIIALRQVLQVQPAHHEARKQLVMALGQAGALDEALKEVEPLRRLEPGNIEWIDLEATLLAFAGRLPESIGRLEMALTRNPQAHTLRRRRGFVYLQAQQWARAQADLEKVLQLAGDDGELRIGLAQAAFQQGQPAQARVHLQAALALPADRCPPELAAAAREKLATLR